MLGIVFGVVFGLVLLEVTVKAVIWTLGFLLMALVRCLRSRSRHRRQQQSPDIVFVQDGEWYFRDETLTRIHGPYVSEASCREAIDVYCEEVLGCKPL